MGEYLSSARQRIGVLLAIFGVMVIGLGGIAPQAQAAPLSGFFTSVEIVPTTAGPKSRMDVAVAFTVPPGAKAGDTATLVLSGPFDWVNATFNILDPGTGEIVAVATVNGDILTVTLTDYVETREDISGTTSLMVAFEAGSVTEGETAEATFTGDSVFHDTVVVGPPNTTPAERNRKTLAWANSTTQDKLVFAIYATTVGQSPDATGEVRIVDLPGGGYTIDCASLEIVEAPDRNGKLGPYAPIPAARYRLTCGPGPAEAPDGFRLVIKGVATDMYIRVRGTATVTDTVSAPPRASPPPSPVHSTRRPRRRRRRRRRP